MSFRLHWIVKVVLFYVLSLAIRPMSSYAQNFAFTYYGPDTLFVGGDNCDAPYSILPNDVNITSTLNANVNFYFDYSAAGFQYNDFFQAGEIKTMYVQASDDQGNTETFTFDVRFADNLPPVFESSSLPDNFLFYSSIEEVPAPAQVTATDNCGDVDVQFTQSELTDTCVGGNIYRTWAATDTTGNTAIHTQTLIIQPDMSPPQFTVFPMNGATDCSAFDVDFPVWLAQNMNTIEAIGAVSYSNNAPISISFKCDTTIVVIFTALDPCGNTTYAFANYQVNDNLSPSVLNPPNDTTYHCTNVPPALRLNNGLQVIDCDPNLIETFNESSSQSTNPQSCLYYNYTIVRDWSIEDHCNNVTNFQQIIMVQDTIAPVFSSAPFSDTTVQCQYLPVFQDIDVVDNCSSNLNIIKNQTFIAGSCTNNYDLSRSWTATDACGNSSSLTQVIHVFDTVAPMFLNLPNDTLLNCGSALPVYDVVALDSCDTDVTLVLIENTTQGADSTACDFYNYTLTKNWLATDNCGNINQATQTITIKDLDNPSIICPQSIVVASDPTMCGKSMVIPDLASVWDGCGANFREANLSDTKEIVHPSGVDANTYPIALTFNLSTSEPTSGITGNIKLQIDLIQVDGEGELEYFHIYAEDSTYLGKTNLTPSQCGNSTTILTNISVTQLSSWLQDGAVNLYLVSTDEAALSINDICIGGQVTVTMSYDYTIQNTDILVQYTLDEGDVLPLTNEVLFLTQGNHSIGYIAEDCAGNQSSCFSTIQVIDEEPPTLSCPDDTLVYVPENSCEGVFILPFPTQISDNCTTNPDFEYVSDTTYLTFVNNANAGLVPQPITFNIPLAPNAISDATILIQFLGDNATNGAYFQVYGEDSTSLGVTAIGSLAEKCSTPVATTLTLTQEQLNDWAEDGLLTITLSPALDASSFSNFISPCENLDANQMDGTSFVQLNLDFQYTSITYTIGDSIGMLFPESPVIQNRSTGVFPITYSVLDNAGLKGNCQWTVTIKDTIAPIAQANNTFVFVNPSGTTTSSIDPTIINNNSSDNCGIVSMTLTPETFSCDQAGNTLPIVLTVIDASGNTDRDTAFVQVLNELPAPNFSQGVCGNDTLFLFANPPAGDYTYSWTGPNGFTSVLQDPFIANPSSIHVGSYEVSIEGLTNCSSANSVQVQMNVLPDTPVLTASELAICSGESVVLATQGFAGSSVEYLWYENANLLTSTSTNSFTIDSLSSGIHQYSVIVNINGCTSSLSNILTITANQAVVLAVTQDTLVACTGDAIQLGIVDPIVGVNYQWTGPNQFTAFVPTINININEIEQNGFYTIAAAYNGCISVTDSTFVQVVPTPAQPQIASINPVCESELVNLYLENYNQGNELHWTSPNGVDTSIYAASFNFNASLSDNGLWTLSVDNGSCQTTLYDIDVIVNEVPAIDLILPANICLGDTMTLSYSVTPNSVSQTWTGPNLLSFQSTVLTIAQAGEYSIVANTSAGCSMTKTIDINPTIPPVITALSNTSDGCFDGESIQLTPTVFPQNDNYAYRWTGPAGYTNCCNTQELILENAGEAIAGEYHLVVTNEQGCRSLEKTTIVEGVNKPNTPILTSQTVTVCEGEPISIDVLNSIDYGEPSLFWLSPKGSVSTNDFTYKVASSTSLDEGQYAAVVVEEGCPSDTSASIYLTIKPKPDKPNGFSNSPVCRGEKIQFSSPTIAGGLYVWTGDNFVSSVQNATIENTTLAHQGGYTVQVSLDGCLSEVSDSVYVEIKELPTQPIINFTSPICANGGTVEMNIAAASQVPGASYTWIFNPNDTIGMPSFFTQYQTTDLTPFHLGQNQFIATVLQDGCFNVSVPIVINIEEQPTNKADAGVDFGSCINQPIFLQAQSPSLGSGAWTQVCGPPVSITNPDANNTTITNLEPNNEYCFVWSLSAGGCENYSQDTVVVTVYQSEEAFAGHFIDTCLVETLKLQASAPAFTTGSWSQDFDQENTGIKIVEKYNPTTKVSGLKPGNLYTFVWTLKDVGCGISKDSVRVRLAQSSPNAGIDQSICSVDSCIQLNAISLGQYDEGAWFAPQGIDFLSNENTAIACGLSIGPNQFVWVLNNGRCGDWSRDTVLINFEPTPIAKEDFYPLDYGLPFLINVVENDAIYSEYEIEILEVPSNSQILNVNKNGTIEIQPNQDFVGIDEFVYRVCNKTCEACTEAKVVLSVGEHANCKVPTIFTPNKDGINDFLIVPCLLSNEYSNATLSIFNQWGDEIYHSNHYQSNWDGTFEGKALQIGTYFFIFDLGDGSPIQKGFIEIQY